jgi:hypothetical protein
MIGAITTGCAWVTDVGATGFTPEEAGAPVSGCSSAHDCDGGALCCVTSITSSSVTKACAPACPTLSGATAVQICINDAECAGGACVEQTCFGSPVLACGLIAVCSADGGSLEDAPATGDSSVPPLDATATGD